MLGSIVASLRFIRRRPIAVLALYALNVATVLAISMMWTVLDELDTGGGLDGLVEHCDGVGLLAQFLGRLALAASAIALFQSSLAHANYTAAPLPIWPDSPAAEAIENLALVGQKAEDKGQTRSR